MSGANRPYDDAAWLAEALRIEDECPHFSVGGLAFESGWIAALNSVRTGRRAPSAPAVLQGETTWEFDRAALEALGRLVEERTRALRIPFDELADPSDQPVPILVNETGEVRCILFAESSLQKMADSLRVPVEQIRGLGRARMYDTRRVFKD